MRALLFFTLSAIACIQACTKCEDPDLTGDGFMVFGHFYGECGGEGCIELFKLEDGKLYEDTLDQYPNSNQAYQGAWVELSAAKYALAKGIPDQVPDQLLSETEHVIGIPDGGDWGGIYVQVENILTGNGYWLLDKNENNMDAVYNDFVDTIESIIMQINQ